MQTSHSELTWIEEAGAKVGEDRIERVITVALQYITHDRFPAAFWEPFNERMHAGDQFIIILRSPGTY